MKKLKSLDRLIDSFSSLPGIGNKTAERLAYSILNMNEEYVNEFIDSLKSVKQNVHQCPICGILTEDAVCEICASPSERETDKLIVVATTKDALAIEKSGNKYPYHVLNGEISLLKNITPESLNIDKLIKRVEENNNIKEVILATNSTLEGETTARFIAKTLEGKNIIISRIAYGIPMNGEIDYVDSFTINKAIDGRTKI